jgi:hypothetical protein
MATLTINDLPSSRALDYQAMSSVRGAGGAPSFSGDQPQSRWLENAVGEDAEAAGPNLSQKIGKKN